jgi:photosystem II stability/assembly factor-like uncharacterized protein
VGDGGLVIHTTDGGLHWTVQATPTAENLRDLHFVDERTGWVVGTYGTVLHTDDGGASWVEQTSPVDDDLMACVFRDAREGWIVGYEGVILHTTDGGATWELEDSYCRAYLEGLAFLPREGVLWVVGGGGAILKGDLGGP